MAMSLYLNSSLPMFDRLLILDSDAAIMPPTMIGLWIAEYARSGKRLARVHAVHILVLNQHLQSIGVQNLHFPLMNTDQAFLGKS